MSAANAVALLSQVKGAKFVSFTYTAKASGEVAKHTLILGASTETLYQKDLARLTRMRGLLVAIKAGMALEAVDAIIASRMKSLEVGIGKREDYTNRDTYTHVTAGVKVHTETGAVYVSGLAHHKTVHVAGTYKTVNSRPLTIMKSRVERMLPSSRFRTFAIDNLSRVAANGEVLELS
jgi:hypothetical protein